MSACPGVLELIETEPSRFDELDVARCVAKLGGSMSGKRAIFPDTVQLAAAFDVLSDRFGARFFTQGSDLRI
jgi:hypothetical protein